MEPGKFVFHDNAEAERTLIVSVSRFSAECDAALSVQPSSPFQLLRHGILKRQNLNLTPDWVFITGKHCSSFRVETRSCQCWFTKKDKRCCSNLAGQAIFPENMDRQRFSSFQLLQNSNPNSRRV